jgi:hypothetical protein
MITLSTGSLPKRMAVGVFQIITYLRELLGTTDTAEDNFKNLSDDITIPAVRISIPSMSYVQEFYGSTEHQIHLRVLSNDMRNPKVMLCFGDFTTPGLITGDIRMSITSNPFKDIKRIEEYESTLIEDQNVKYTLIKICFEEMDITIVKWW